MKIKNFNITFCNDWKDWDSELINIELLSFHLERDYVTKKISSIWITVLGFGIWGERE